MNFEKQNKFLAECKEYPYGFLCWITRVWLILVEKRAFKNNDRSGLHSMDLKAWSVHFYNGLSPQKAVQLDINEGGE